VNVKIDEFACVIFVQHDQSSKDWEHLRTSIYTWPRTCEWVDMQILGHALKSCTKSELYLSYTWVDLSIGIRKMSLI